MTLGQFIDLPSVVAKRDVGRCLLCGERFERGSMIKDGGLYEKIHSACGEFAASRLDAGRQVTIGLRRNFIEARSGFSSTNPA